jgi:hypothetical protein
MDDIQEFGLTVMGCDGSMWPIHGPESWGRNVRLMEGDMGEFYEPPIKTVHKARVGQPGSSYVGSKTMERHVVLNVDFFGEDWAHDKSRFMRAFAPDKDTKLAVTTPMSGKRLLTVRLEEGPKYLDNRDPFSLAAASYQLVVIAHDPFYYEPVPFRHKFVFNGSNWAGDGITVNNHGDVESWPQWVLISPAKFGLPDQPIGENFDTDRMIFLPWQPVGRTMLVDTNPGAEMVVANDNTQAWADLNGQFFKHPIPPGTPDTRLPVYVDPFPLLDIPLPYQWRMWIAQKLRELVKAIGLDTFLAITPEEIGKKISEWMKGNVPDWVPILSDDLIADFTGDMIAYGIRQTYGSFANIAGATAEIRIPRRWQSPWL